MRSRGIHPSMPATAAGILARTRGGDVADLPNCMQALTRGGDVADLPNCIHSSMPATADSAIHVVSKAQPRRLKSLPSVTDSDAREEFQIRSFTELNSSPANDLRISCREAVSPDGAGFSVAHVGEVLLVRCGCIEYESWSWRSGSGLHKSLAAQRGRTIAPLRI